MVSVNKKIKCIREWLNLSIKDVSQYINTSVYIYRLYETDNYDIPYQKLYLISRLYNLDYRILLLSFDLDVIKGIITNSGLLKYKKEELYDELYNNMFENNKGSIRTLNEISNKANINMIHYVEELVKRSNIEEVAKTMGLTPKQLELSLYGNRPFQTSEITSIISKAYLKD